MTFALNLAVVPHFSSESPFVSQHLDRLKHAEAFCLAPKVIMIIRMWTLKFMTTVIAILIVLCSF